MMSFAIAPAIKPKMIQPMIAPIGLLQRPVFMFHACQSKRQPENYEVAAPVTYRTMAPYRRTAHCWIAGFLNRPTVCTPKTSPISITFGVHVGRHFG